MDILRPKSPQFNRRWPQDRIPANQQPCFKCGERPRYLDRSLCKECHSEWKSAYNRRTYNPERQRERHLRSKFKLSQADYDLLFFQQGGMCAVCGKVETKIHPVTGKVWPLAMDHNHETGQVRELLCCGCNTLLGHLERDRERVKKLLKYLKKHDT